MIIPALICGMMFTGCGSDKSEETVGELQYVKTELGGCNLKSALKSDSDDLEAKDDELIITVSAEAVHVFVGLNYICCAPFETNCETIDDVIVMYIIDTCKNPYVECYCKCMCYYTFDFVFTHQEKFNQKYKILLLDPREEKPIIISEGTITENK